MAKAAVCASVHPPPAIPATIAYNAFGGRIDAVLGNLERFSSQFQEDLARLMQGQGAMQPVVGAEGAGVRESSRAAGGE